MFLYGLCSIFNFPQWDGLSEVYKNVTVLIISLNQSVIFLYSLLDSGSVSVSEPIGLSLLNDQFIEVSAMNDTKVGHYKAGEQRIYEKYLKEQCSVPDVYRSQE